MDEAALESYAQMAKILVDEDPRYAEDVAALVAELRRMRAERKRLGVEMRRLKDLLGNRERP
jgi:hypothetical protein